MICHLEVKAPLLSTGQKAGHKLLDNVGAILLRTVPRAAPFVVYFKKTIPGVVELSRKINLNHLPIELLEIGERHNKTGIAACLLCRSIGITTRVVDGKITVIASEQAIRDGVE
jgi:hypothetical protein